MSKPLRSAIPFRAPHDEVLKDGLSSAYKPNPVKSSVAPSGLCSTESEGNPGKISASLGYTLGYGREFPVDETNKRSIFIPPVQYSCKCSRS